MLLFSFRPHILSFLVFAFSLFSSVTQSCPTLCNPMGCSTPGFSVHHQLLKLAQTHVYRVSDAIQPSYPLLLLLLPLIFPSIKVFSNESTLLIRWPKYWSFSFSISPSNEGSPCSPRDSQESSSTPQFRSINFSALSFLYGSTLMSIRDYWKDYSFEYQNNVFAF